MEQLVDYFKVVLFFFFKKDIQILLKESLPAPHRHVLSLCMNKTSRRRSDLGLLGNKTSTQQISSSLSLVRRKQGRVNVPQVCFRVYQTLVIGNSEVAWKRRKVWASCWDPPPALPTMERRLLLTVGILLLTLRIWRRLTHRPWGIYTLAFSQLCWRFGVNHAAVPCLGSPWGRGKTSWPS